MKTLLTILMLTIFSQADMCDTYSRMTLQYNDLAMNQADINDRIVYGQIALEYAIKTKYACPKALWKEYDEIIAGHKLLMAVRVKRQKGKR